MKFLKGLLLLATIATLSACGNNAIVENISVKTSQDANQDIWVALSTQLNMGALSFPALTIPVVNPKFPSELLGQVSLQRSLEGKNVLVVNANISEIGKNQLTNDNLLPNGNAIPVAGLSGVVAVKFNSSSKVFLGGSNDSLMVGIALAIPLFDNIGKYLPGVNMFLPLPTASQIEGLGGVFTGSAGQSGIGIFVKVPSTINTTSSKTILASNSIQTTAPDLSSRSIMTKSSAVSSAAAASSLKFLASNEGSSKSVSLKRMLFNLSQQKRTLTIK
jgi:hypothetical protein